MRTNLKLLRVKHNLSQQEMGAKIGVSRQTYQAIESGCRCGSQKFWGKVQNVFEIPEAEMWELTIDEKNG